MRYISKFLARFCEKRDMVDSNTEMSQSVLELMQEINNLAPGCLEHMLQQLCIGLDVSSSENEKFIAAEALTTYVYPKYKFSEYGRLFLEDDEFIKYYMQFMDVNNWHSMDRKYVLRELIKLTKSLDGDFAECGCYKGASAFLLCQYNVQNERKIHLFDSFEGLSNPEENDGQYWSEGSLTATEQELTKSLEGFENYFVYKGWIPERFSDVYNLRFSFVHIDVDLYSPTLASLEFFYERMVSGGVMLLDDYGFTSCPGAKDAADMFFGNKIEEIINLPTGQAFIIKK